MSKDKKGKHARAPGMTQISISLPKRLVEKVDRLAELQNRSRSNFIAYIIDRLAEEEGTVPYLQAAEPKSSFTSK